VTPLWISNEVHVRALPAVLRELAARPDVERVGPVETITAPARPVALRVPSATRTASDLAGPAATAAVASAATAEPNIAAVHAPDLWSLGIRGQGVVVAGLDTGVDATHPDLSTRWRGGAHSWFDPYGQHATPVDVNGHGTATMGVAVGGDSGGTSIGVAPGATWIAAKIFDDRGAATTTAIHQAFQWVLDPDGDPLTDDAADVVNNSWSASSTACSTTFQPDLQALVAAAITPVFAAGNGGPTAGSVTSPANLPQALAVGDVTGTDAVDASSSRGPSACVDVRTSDVYGSFIVASGTSLAAPHVTGALALLASAAPGSTPAQRVAALESGALDLGPAGTDPDYGYGRLDALAAYQRLVTVPDLTVAVSPGTVSAAAGSTASFIVDVHGVNGFGGDVALSLTGLSGSQAGWTFSPDVVTGGTGSAQLTITPSAGLPPGTYPITVTAAGGEVSHAATATLVVSAPADFGISPAKTSASVVAGGSVTTTVSVTALNGFTGTVGLTVSGAPSGVTATFSPASVTGSGSSTLTVTASASSAAGSYPLTVTGASGGLVHSTVLTLVVTAAPSFTLAVSPPSVTVSRGQTASYTVTVTATGGFTGTVQLKVAGLPSSTTVSWSTNPVVGSGTSTLRARVGWSAPRGTFALTVTGTSGSTVRQVPATLVVR
jgi:subtilisin family serine protease